MDRSKRAIRTPKRFDDEAFETPPPPVKPAKPVEPQPQLSQPKSIIKVKLRPPRESIETSPDLKKDISTPKTKPPKPKPRETVEPAIEVKTPERDNKQQIKSKRPRAQTVSVENTPKPKEIVEPAVVEAKTPERETKLKTKKPRAQPVFADIIPNVVLPFWDARTAAEDHEDDNVKELVHCHCGVGEELGLMVQCETCLTWQHAHCLGIERPEDAPDGYTCRACSDPKFAREPMKWAYDQDWLIKGRMKQFSCDPRPIPERNVNILKQINNLIGNVLNIQLIIHSLRIKAKLLENASDDDPELKLFRVQWPANYQHRDGTHFISTINHPSSTPASMISVNGETPDPADINVAEATLPDIGQLDDVSAILDDTYVPNHPIQPMETNHDAKPNDCKSNLKLHIQQTEEFIGIELAQIEEQLSNLEKECSHIDSGDLALSLDSLKNDLQTMKKYVENRE